MKSVLTSELNDWNNNKIVRKSPCSPWAENNNIKCMHFLPTFSHRYEYMYSTKHYTFMYRAKNPKKLTLFSMRNFLVFVYYIIAYTTMFLHSIMYFLIRIKVGIVMIAMETDWFPTLWRGHWSESLEIFLGLYVTF